MSYFKIIQNTFQKIRADVDSVQQATGPKIQKRFFFFGSDVVLVGDVKDYQLAKKIQGHLQQLNVQIKSLQDENHRLQRSGKL